MIGREGICRSFASPTHGPFNRKRSGGAHAEAKCADVFVAAVGGGSSRLHNPFLDQMADVASCCSDGLSVMEYDINSHGGSHEDEQSDHGFHGPAAARCLRSHECAS